MRTILVAILFLSSIYSFAQYTKKNRVAKVVIEERSIYLNGGLRASTGGKSRVVVPFDLPKNTVEWYYSFSTSEGESGTKNLNLALQLSSFLVDPSGITSNFLEKLEIPAGSGSIDVYLLSSENQKAFVEKWDNNGGTFYHIEEAVVQNTKQAAVRVDDVKSGRWYLGLNWRFSPRHKSLKKSTF